MEGGIVPNAASGIGVHFPSQCRPQDHLQQLGGPHGKIAAARRAARCRLFHRQSRAAAGRGSARYRVRGLDWDGGWRGCSVLGGGPASGGRGGRGPEVGGAPEVWGERSGQGVKTSTNGDTTVATESWALHLKLSGCQTCHCSDFQTVLRRRSTQEQGHWAANDCCSSPVLDQ